MKVNYFHLLTFGMTVHHFTEKIYGVKGPFFNKFRLLVKRYSCPTRIVLYIPDPVLKLLDITPIPNEITVRLLQETRLAQRGKLFVNWPKAKTICLLFFGNL